MVSRRTLTAVVVEDDFLVAKDVVRVATEAGIDVLATASDGEKGLEAIKRYNPNVAIVDVKMPRMDGLTLARRLREEHPIPVVILTAYETPEFVQEAAEAGVGGYLTKPAKASTMWRAVLIAAARHAELMQLRRDGSVSICTYCKRVQGEDGSWQDVEFWVAEQAASRVARCLCAECLAHEMREQEG